jgi:uncharacterized protein YjbJ (UPF0337 family)
MNRDQVMGKWRELKGEAKIQWGKLTNDDLDMVEGNVDKLVGAVQQRYGYEKEQAQREVDRFIEQRSKTVAHQP